MNRHFTALLLSFLLLLATALYFSKAAVTLHPGYYLVLSLTALGIVFQLLYRFTVGTPKDATTYSALVLPSLFQIVHGGVAFALVYFLFQGGWKLSLTYPLGVFLGLKVLGTVRLDLTDRWRSFLAAALLAVGFAIALRLGEIPGGLLYALGLFGSKLVGWSFFANDPERQNLWARALIFTALLAVGRGAIQYYLVISNYANLGVVITHPYTYAALFAGIFLPLWFWLNDEESLLPNWATVILLGVILPLALGIVIHVRPMAGFLLGLVSSSFLVGMVFAPSWGLGTATYLALATSVFSLPLFQTWANWSRQVRLILVIGLGLLAALIFLARQAMYRRS